MRLTVAALALSAFFSVAYAQVLPGPGLPVAGGGGCTTSTFDKDGTTQTGNATATSVAAAAFSTTFCSNLVVVGVVTNSVVTSVTDSQSHLTFTKRAASGGTNDIEIWTAPLSGAALSGDVITVNLSFSAFTTILVNSFSGYKTATPFDPNVALPSTTTTGACSFTTTNANDILYGFAETTSNTPDAGWTLLGNATSAANFLNGQYKVVSATQSAATTTLLNANGTACDAIQKGP